MKNLPPVALVVDDVHVDFDVYVSERPDAQLRSLVTGQRRRATVKALNGVSFVLRQGDSLGVMGHNGSGKSTLLAAIGGQLTCTRGKILVRSQPKMLGGATSVMNAKLSGRDNIALGLLSIGMKPDDVATKTDEVMEFCELGEFIDMPVTTYSRGMRARLQFAIRTQERPDILLLDEALAVGDKTFKEKSLERVNDIRALAGVVIMATHQLDEIRESCNYAIYLKDGHQMGFGEPDEIIEQYEASRESERNTVERRRRRSPKSHG